MQPGQPYVQPSQSSGPPTQPGQPYAQTPQAPQPQARRPQPQPPETWQRGRRGALAAASAAPATFTLIGINLAVWILLVFTGGGRSPLFSFLALDPTSRCLVRGGYYTGMPAGTCTEAGGQWYPGVADGAWWTTLTSAFTHVDALHIGFNMMALYFLGPILEQALGRTRYLAVYLLSALAGSTAVFWLSDPTTSTLGASGAIFGLMGALLVIARARGGDTRVLMTWLGLNVVMTFLMPSISWQGHLGGLAGGLVVAMLLTGRRGARSEWVSLGVMAFVLVAAIAVRTLILS